MTQKEMNSYRLTSMEEPSDEHLSALMKEVAEEARKKSEEAHKNYFRKMYKNIREQKKEWAKKYNINFG